MRENFLCARLNISFSAIAIRGVSLKRHALWKKFATRRRKDFVEIFEEEKKLQQAQNIPISEQERNDKIDKIIKNDFKRYKNVFKALA